VVNELLLQAKIVKVALADTSKLVNELLEQINCVNATKSLIPVKSAMFLLATFKLVTVLIFAVVTKSLKPYRSLNL